jgi:magnesium transporter
MDPPMTADDELDLAPETALVHASRDVPVVPPEATAVEALKQLSAKRHDHAGTIAVCEDGRLRGIIRSEDLFAASPDATAKDLMDPDPPAVRPGVDQEAAAWHMVRRQESSMAVVDADGKFLGFILASTMLGVLLREHAEDMARIGGFSHDTEVAATAIQEKVGRRIRHRLPWLLVGLAGSLIAANIVDAFQAEIRQTLALAFFLPGIVYLADAVGTQTETLVIRGLSVGVPIGRAFRQEAVTGVLIGIGLGVLFFPFALWLSGDTSVAVYRDSPRAPASVALQASRCRPCVRQRTAGDRDAGHRLSTDIPFLCGLVYRLNRSTSDLC